MRNTIKNESKNVNKNSVFCSIFVIFFTFWPEKIAWWTPVLKHYFYIFYYNEPLRKIYRNFIDKFLFYHTSLKQLVRFSQNRELVSLVLRSSYFTWMSPWCHKWYAKEWESNMSYWPLGSMGRLRSNIF